MNREKIRVQLEEFFRWSTPICLAITAGAIVLTLVMFFLAVQNAWPTR